MCRRIWNRNCAGQHNSNIKYWQKMGACIEIIKTKNASIYLEGENNE